MMDVLNDATPVDTEESNEPTVVYARHNPLVTGDSTLANGELSKTVSCPQLNIFGKRKTKCKGSDDDDDDGIADETDLFITKGVKPTSSLHGYMDNSVKNAKDSFNHAFDKVDKFAHKVWDGRSEKQKKTELQKRKKLAKKDYSQWRVVSFFQLQDWQKDNEFLHHWHRPAMPSFRACFGSIFRLHTETGNIWTHLLDVELESEDGKEQKLKMFVVVIGVIFFIAVCIHFLCLPATRFISAWQEKIVFFLFFLGAVLCLCFSTLFHTMGCHSERVFRIFGKLDYSGIALMIMGSFVPWIYYSFYCDSEPKVIYMSCICVLGVLCIVISQWDKFGTAKYRSTRAIVFAALGLSGIVPAIHMTFKLGFLRSVTVGQLGWLYLMAGLYLTGAFLYACRIPERYFPGKCDLVFQSHQIFHVLVVAAAIVHFHGISKLQEFRFQMGEQCVTD